MNKTLRKQSTQKRVAAYLSLIMWLVIVSGCTQQPERNFTTSDLIIPIEKMPTGLEFAFEPSPMGLEIGFGDADDTYVSFKPITSKYYAASHYVLLFNNSQKAENWYEREFPSEFNSNSIAVDEPWQTPPELVSFKSRMADQYYVACTINNIAGPKQVCEFMAQYDEFVVIFSSGIRPGIMTIEQFKDVIGEIDQIMVTFLQE